MGTEGHAPKESRRRFAAVLWVYTQSTALVTTTRTEGARVVLTLPVARKRLRGGAGLGGAQPGSCRFLRTSERGKAGTAIEKKPRGKNSSRIARCARKCRRKLYEVFGGVGSNRYRKTRAC